MDEFVMADFMPMTCRTCSCRHTYICWITILRVILNMNIDIFERSHNYLFVTKPVPLERQYNATNEPFLSFRYTLIFILYHFRFDCFWF
jgi:hypothetical protein